jgi:hypothetical protein
MASWYNAFTAGKFPRSVRKMVVLATSAQLPPQSARIPAMLARTWRVWASTPSAIVPSASMPIWPAITIQSPARTAGE